MAKVVNTPLFDKHVALGGKMVDFAGFMMPVQYDGIISDMAPDTSGDRLTDCYDSSYLVVEALQFAYNYLKKGGYFIAKIFQGGDEKKIMSELKKTFKQAKWFKPKSSRKNSYEIYIIGIGFIQKPIEIAEKSIIDQENYTGDMPW